MTPRAKEIARWVAVLPGAALCVFVAEFPIHWTVLFIHHFANDPDSAADILANFSLGAIPVEVLEYFANALLIPFLFIAIGTRIAPRFKLQTGIALAVLVGLFIGYLLPQVVRDITDGLYTAGRWLRLGITFLLWGVSISWGLYSARLQAKQARAQVAA